MEIVQQLRDAPLEAFICVTTCGACVRVCAWVCVRPWVCVCVCVVQPERSTASVHNDQPNPPHPTTTLSAWVVALRTHAGHDAGRKGAQQRFHDLVHVVEAALRVEAEATKELPNNDGRRRPRDTP